MRTVVPLETYLVTIYFSLALADPLEPVAGAKNKCGLERARSGPSVGGVRIRAHLANAGCQNKLPPASSLVHPPGAASCQLPVASCELLNC